MSWKTTESNKITNEILAAIFQLFFAVILLAWFEVIKNTSYLPSKKVVTGFAKSPDVVAT